MADVFVSYKREDRAIAERAAAFVQRAGLSTFFDVNIPVGDTWDQVIEAELRAAKAVLVLWTPSSVNSRWVRIEARDALTRGILCPVIVEDCAIPLEFQDVQAAQVSSFDLPSGDLDRLLERLFECLEREGTVPEINLVRAGEGRSEYQHYCELVRASVEACDFISFLTAQPVDPDGSQQVYKAFSRLKIDIGQLESLERRVYGKMELCIDLQNAKFFVWEAAKRADRWLLLDQFRRSWMKRDIDEAAYYFSRRHGIIRPDLVERTRNDEDAQESRNPAWFSGSRLSEQGVAAIYRMYDEGRSVYAAAKAMGISYSAASHRRELWKERQG